MWQLALIYLALAVVAGVLAVVFTGAAHLVAAVASGTLLALAVIAFVAWLLPRPSGRRVPRA